MTNFAAHLITNFLAKKVIFFLLVVLASSCAEKGKPVIPDSNKASTETAETAEQEVSVEENKALQDTPQISPLDSDKNNHKTLHFFNETSILLHKLKKQAPLHNHLFDSVERVELNMKKRIPEVLIYLTPNKQLQLIQKNFRSDRFEYSAGVRSLEDKNKFIEIMTVTVDILAADRSLSLITISDLLKTAQLQIVRIQKKASVQTSSMLLKKSEKNSSLSFYIPDELDRLANRSFERLLKIMFLKPESEITFYHVLRNPLDSLQNPGRSERITADISDNFYFHTLNIAGDLSRHSGSQLDELIRVEPDNKYQDNNFINNLKLWNIFRTSDKAFIYLNNFNLATHAFYKNRSQGEFLTYLKVPNNNIVNALLSDNIEFKVYLKPDDTGKAISKNPAQYSIHLRTETL